MCLSSKLSLSYRILVGLLLIASAGTVGGSEFRRLSELEAFQPLASAVVDPGPQEEQEPQDSEVVKPALATEADDLNDQPATPREPIDDQLVQVELLDGSVVSGKVEVNSITINTEFGVLQIPVGKIERIYPGLDSYPELQNQIAGLVESLGDKDFENREKAQRELLDMGMMLRFEIRKIDDGGSAERKKRLAEIIKEVDEMLEDDEFDGDSDKPRGLIRGDTVQTENFSIVGQVQQSQFLVHTKFGDLKINLADIKSIDRTVFGVSPPIRKSLQVKGDTFFQREPLKTSIRVNKGDRVTIRGSGVVQWTNWNTSSTPVGLPNQGQFEGINAGTLIGRIGSSGKVIEIGEEKSFVASSSGLLYLAIAVQDAYANNTGYRWTGGYQVKIRVEPKN